MDVLKKKGSKQWLLFMLLVIVTSGVAIYYVYFFTPKSSLELYQQIHFAEDFEEVQTLMLDGYEDQLKEEDFIYIKSSKASSISQFTLLDYEDRSYVIMTTAGTELLRILAVNELPEEVRDYFLELGK